MPLPSGVSQRTWSAAASEPITASLLRQNVTDPVWLLTSPPMAILQQTATATTVPSGAATPIGMDTETLDTTSGHSDTVNASRWYAAVPGWYLVRGAVAYSGSASNQGYGFTCSCDIHTVSSNTTQSIDMCIGNSSANALALMSGAELCVLSAPSSAVTSNDYVYLYAYQNTGSSLPTNITVPSVPYMMIRWVATVTGTAGLPVPSNPAFSDTTGITGAFMNANVRDAVNFLTFPPMARLTATSVQSIPSTSFPADNAITFQSAAAAGVSSSSDNYSGWSSGTNPTRYTFPRAGRYYAYGQVAFAAAGTAGWAAGLRVNGGTTQWGARMDGAETTSFGTMPNIETVLRVNAGDYVELIGSQSSGSSVSTIATATTASKLIVLWEGS